MSDEKSVTVPKWPFFLGDATLFAVACVIYFSSDGSLGLARLGICAGCVALGAALGVWPFLLDHRARIKRLEADALGSATEKLSNLEKIAGQISAASNEWQNAHLQAEKASGAAREITERITTEARAFTEFLQKTNDGEKATLRLEVEKLRRAETDSVQVLMHVLDHVHALVAGAVRSGQPRLIEQFRQFQNACHDAARRVGLVPFRATPGETFDAQRHKPADGKSPVPGATISETIAAGFNFQGKLIRPALVQLPEASAEAAQSAEPESALPASEQSQFSLEGQPGGAA